MKESKNPFSVKKAEDSTGFLLWQVTNLWQREIRKALEIYDLTHSQFVLLASIHWLTLHGNKVTQTLLSSHAKIDPMTTSTVLRTLQKKGFVMRQEHATDTRAKTVVLTIKGKEVTQRAVKTVELFDKEFFHIPDSKKKDFNMTLIKLINQGN